MGPLAAIPAAIAGMMGTAGAAGAGAATAGTLAAGTAATGAGVTAAGLGSGAIGTGLTGAGLAAAPTVIGGGAGLGSALGAGGAAMTPAIAELATIPAAQSGPLVAGPLMPPGMGMAPPLTSLPGKPSSVFPPKGPPTVPGITQPSPLERAANTSLDVLKATMGSNQAPRGAPDVRMSPVTTGGPKALVSRPGATASPVQRYLALLRR